MWWKVKLKKKITEFFRDLKWFIKWELDMTPGNMSAASKKFITNPYTIFGIGILITLIQDIPYVLRIILGSFIMLFALLMMDYKNPEWRRYKKKKMIEYAAKLEKERLRQHEQKLLDEKKK